MRSSDTAKGSHVSSLLVNCCSCIVVLSSFSPARIVSITIGLHIPLPYIVVTISPYSTKNIFLFQFQPSWHNWKIHSAMPICLSLFYLLMDRKIHHTNVKKKKATLMSFKRPKWPIKPNKRSHFTMFSCLTENITFAKIYQCDAPESPKSYGLAIPWIESTYYWTSLGDWSLVPWENIVLPKLVVTKISSRWQTHCAWSPVASSYTWPPVTSMHNSQLTRMHHS